MQSTERVVMKRNNQSAFIDKSVDNVVEYLLRFCFLQRASFYLLDQHCRLTKTSAHFQSSAAIWNEYVTFSTPRSWYFGQKSTKCPRLFSK